MYVVSVVIVKLIFIVETDKKWLVIMLNLYDLVWYIMYFYLFRLFMLRISLCHAISIETMVHCTLTLTTHTFMSMEWSSGSIFFICVIFSFELRHFFLLFFDFMLFDINDIDFMKKSENIIFYLSFNFSAIYIFHFLFLYDSHHSIRFKNCNGLLKRIIFIRTICRVDKMRTTWRLSVALMLRKREAS